MIGIPTLRPARPSASPISWVAVSTATSWPRCTSSSIVIGAAGVEPAAVVDEAAVADREPARRVRTTRHPDAAADAGTGADVHAGESQQPQRGRRRRRSWAGAAACESREGQTWLEAVGLCFRAAPREEPDGVARHRWAHIVPHPRHGIALGRPRRSIDTSLHSAPLPWTRPTTSTAGTSTPSPTPTCTRTGTTTSTSRSRNPTLVRTESCDLCIVGGGYTGLWTAIIAKERDPSRDVVLIDAARGRLGGQRAQRRVHGVEPDPRHRQRPGALPATSSSCSSSSACENLDAIENAIHRYDIDCDFERTGVIDVATTAHPPSYLDELRDDALQLRRLGQDARWLDADGDARRGRLADLHRRAVAHRTGPRSSTRPGWCGG